MTAEKEKLAEEDEMMEKRLIAVTNKMMEDVKRRTEEMREDEEMRGRRSRLREGRRR